MIKEKDFFDYDWNRKGKSFKNQIEARTIEEDIIVNDNAAGLMWQQSGSQQRMNYEQAKHWIDDLNHKNYAGFNDWRLPTLEEAISLLQNNAKKDDLFLNSAFDRIQWSIWTSDIVGSDARTWVVSYSLGGCSGYLFNNINFVRSVRTI